MRDHVLLQAIARVNRPYEDTNGIKKACRLVIDFVGIFNQLEKALDFDSSDMAGVVSDWELLKKELQEKIKIAKIKYISLIENKPQNIINEIIWSEFRDQNKRNDFYLFFKQISNIFEILSPDPFLSEYLHEYETLTKIYQLLCERYEKEKFTNGDLLKRIKTLVRDHTKTNTIQISETFELNETGIEKIYTTVTLEENEIFSIYKTIKKKVDEKGKSFLYLISIGEKAEEIKNKFQEGQLETKKALEELKKLNTESLNIKKEQAESKLTKEGFYIYKLLQKENIKDCKTQAFIIQNHLEEYTYWWKDESQKRELRQNIYSVLLEYLDLDTTTKIVDKIFRDLENAKN